MDSASLQRSLCSLLFLCSCSLLLPTLGAVRCDEEEAAACVENTLQGCVDGYVLARDCGTDRCNVTALSCEANTAPQAEEDRFSVSQNTSLLLVPEALLVNDFDQEGDLLHVASVLSPENGTVSQEEDGILFVPDDDFFGRARFVYQVSDGLLVAEAEVVVDVFLCGDGAVQVGEVCDDGNILSGDGCRSDCGSEERCGDGVLEFLEECDDGNTIAGDGCDAFCVIEFCGDGITQANLFEDCDDANLSFNDGCTPSCIRERCGDGIVNNVVEVCDDGNTSSGDGCRGNCVGLEICGDGLLDVDEQCDDGNVLTDDGCSDQCVQEVCGDGVLQLGLGEQCDDGNILSGDGCDAGCFLEFCGDNTVQVALGEQCDDGNNLDKDGCSALCLQERCGDGIVNNVVEVCDDGNTNSGDGCRGDCRKLERCGDGAIDVGEQCDDGNILFNDGCDSICRVERCGDGILQTGIGEECDDGNLSNGDGCRNVCLLERCGDGVVNNNNELCDDGNTNSGDGCRGDCRKLERCGDAVLDANEACDDGNIVDDDGCSRFCLIEFCGDGVVQSNTTEECDDGNADNGDGCDSSCAFEPDFFCANASAVGVGTLAKNTLNGSEVFFGQDSGAVQRCLGGSGFGRELIFALTPSTSGIFSFTLVSVTDQGFYLRTICNNDSTEIACVDENVGGVPETLSIALVANETVFLFVDAFDVGEEGAFVMTIQAP